MHEKSGKEWITPLIKHLINERWKAYREYNWPQYNHLKMKIKNEIKKQNNHRQENFKVKNTVFGIWRNELQTKIVRLI